MNLLQKVVQDRDIEYVIHFTRLDNLPSIMERGLIPRSQLEAEGIDVTFNDDERIDECPNATCFSIAFPNYKMFWACRKEFSGIDWVVLIIDASVLWEKDCAFCHENAASNDVTCIPLSDRKGSDAFNSLYEEISGKPTRKELGISDRAPTNPQAEVLVFDVIDPELIVEVIVENRAMANKTNKLYPNMEAQVDKRFFNARKDYKHWKKTEAE